ncbi:hypothetical protein A1O3_03799 [Capronia epimyces CBS 606.96]|uniref:Guanine nucleotide exchange factor LTE1 n=1 Tax=Capronia epimyces CBS 606.96 TaxID=1182542 RepID=W9YB47_9EURO|nr:uncharacterized protein A1O3_03799 [Capronia epimyces CBS 606.96]EXJ86845.1 hypothetical protein A1O3_03799 [Capronia epimyces CBS 606.96]
MVSESTISSHVSLISLDPVLASHITGATTAPTASQHGSSPRKSSMTPDTDLSRRHYRNNSAPNATPKKRSNSLRRAKNSTEVLRQRSTKLGRKTKPLDSIADTREGRNFTIGNVGTGGILYLTPSAHQIHVPPQNHVVSPVVLTIPSTAPAHLGDDDYASFSNSKIAANPSDVAPLPRSASPSERSRRLSVRAVSGPHHGRSQSFSTVEDHRQSLSASKSKTLKIVINRPNTARPESVARSSREENKDALPTLEVPIPHYRIGTFRFSSHGTPMLRSSSYTRGSVAPSDMTPTAAMFDDGRHVGATPAPGLEVFAKPDASPVARETSFGSTSRTVSTLTSSARPKLFDDLNAVYDDPSIVRYCQNVQEITAATPARIIAQISSDSFMDYELVSDFFLTFRSYMSTHSVLDLLLARLRWAIGRLEEDGRIIRVRTFAALRHWILNYFMDDFFVDLRLRQRFCDEINELYADVKASPQHGFSDLKLLRDLKRCWNGRCSLCWSPEDFQLDGDQEEEIQPGGGTVDTEATPTSRVGVSARPHPVQPQAPQPEVLRGPSTSWFEADPSVKSHQRHTRQKSLASDRDPDSLASDGSLHVNSCFAPKYLLKPSGDGDAFCKGPHPVSVQQRRKNAPANLQVKTHTTLAPKSLGHKRGASSIDSNREPTPRKSDTDSPAVLVEDGGIIRGLLYSPSAPFVQIVSSGSTQSLDRNEPGSVQGLSGREHGAHTGNNPVGRNIFGSLRKVLSSKHGNVNVTLLAVSQSSQDAPVRGHKSHLPLNVSKSHDELRHKAGTAMSKKGEVRIDLLCAAVCQSYETKFPTKRRITYGPLFASHPPFQPTADGSDRLITPRQVSHATAESGSILIVDATGDDVPAMSGALPADQPNEITPALSFQDGHAVATGELRGGSIDAAATQRSSNVLGDERDTPAIQGPEGLSESGTMNLAQSGPPSEDSPGLAEVARRPLSPMTASSRTVRDDVQILDVSEPIESVSPEDVPTLPADPDPVQNEQDKDLDDTSQPSLPSHPLRRRPGGDLRLVGNVQDLDHASHHASLDTASAASDSPHESLLIMKTETAIQGGPTNAPPPNKTVSMINTHSSQHLRPSFEAAIAGFSAIPDDDDGGLEATLMKLEGRYEKKSPPIDQHPIDTTGKRRSLPDFGSSSRRHYPASIEPITLAGPVSHPSNGQIRATVNEVASESSHDERSIDAPEVVEAKPLSSRRSSIYGLPTESVADSEESYGSLPLLKRERGFESVSQVLPLDVDVEAPPGTIAPGYFAQDPPQLFHLPKGPPPSASKNHNSGARPSTANESAQSFLLDEDENLSDLSSEISVDIINHAEIADRSIQPMLAAPGTALSGLEIPAHPLTYASVVNLNVPEDPTRISDPVGAAEANRGATPPPPQPTQFQDSSSLQPLARLPAGPAHIPFVLACDSQVLAQQMTLVEKSALSEVEWSDLVDMRWSSKAADILDWVDCLTNGHIRGIDLVITRFNLVVKWALSEIILTHDVHERARVITKFIHVAAHARRLHNYATMLQLTIALTSTDCTRLTKTWDMVSGPDKSLLKHMEALVQPVRNFHELRLEMESADLSDGCVPFIGLYVHDLTYNAQKPSQIQVGRGTEPLVNFERYRTTALIVKGLLRLIDASSRYNFDPLPGVIERCLWLAALSDGQIRSASQMLER